jgi:hypothetical protein
MGKTPTFRQSDYNLITDHLDAVIDHMKGTLGKTEEEAQKMLVDWINLHYIPVWRKIQVPK